jgi:hypothetical protein
LLFLQEIINERPNIAAENLVCARLTIEKQRENSEVTAERSARCKAPRSPANGERISVNPIQKDVA